MSETELLICDGGTKLVAQINNLSENPIRNTKALVPETGTSSDSSFMSETETNILDDWDDWIGDTHSDSVAL